MQISLIIPTRNRADQLERCLAAVAAAAEPPCRMEIIVVDNGSSDATGDVIAAFGETSPFTTRAITCPKPGASAARNAGIAQSKGQWLLFIDDDCYVEREYFVKFHGFLKDLLRLSPAGDPIAYGCGPIHFFDERDDTRIAGRYLKDLWIIPKHSLLAASAVQSANMFCRRAVAERIGGFNERLGAGTPFASEDIDFACRASLAGYTGAQVPSFTVYHDHGRRAGSSEAEAVLAAYDYGRGAYYAALLDRGLIGAWQLWSSACALEGNADPALRERLARELQGAADYMKLLNETKPRAL